VEYFKGLSLLEEYLMAMSMSMDRLEQGVQATVSPPQKQEGPYDAETLDAFGDETINKEVDIRQKEIAKLTPSYFGDKMNPNAKVWMIISGFYEWCQKNHVKLLATFPSFMYFEEYHQPKNKKYFDSIVGFYQQQGIPILGTPYEFMYDRSLFFDTLYHPHDRGALLHTERLITYLRQYI
jgi:hypothetical protein